MSYLGRTIDLSAYQGLGVAGVDELRQSVADLGQSGIALTGILKLAQRYLLELFTEKGSIFFSPTRGSTFLQEARFGFIRTQTDLISAYTRAMIDVNRNLADDELETDPLDEQLLSAVLEGVIFTPGYASITVRLTSRDPKASIIIPVPFVF